MAELLRPWGHLRYRVLGDPTAPRLLYVHGSGSSLANVEPMLDRWAERFRLLAFDHRGMGDSDVPTEPYTMADVADDVVALLDAVGWSWFRMFGISYGGMVAQHVAAMIPARVERLVLACTSSGGAGGSSYPLHELHDLPETERRRVLPTILDTRFTPAFLATDARARAIVEARTEGGTPVDPVALRLQMGARRAHDAYDALDRITCPTLVAVGATDGIAPPENGRRIAERLSDATIATFDGGHLFILQDRTATPTLQTFLAADHAVDE
ncbi:MAG: alpha/beta fold hydrolase [Actinobacteria bacterium]|nr:alpha/beta fold hydrolase [Actinomycetota bacterium]